MLNIKIVEFKCINDKEDDFYSRSLLEEDNAYTIKEFRDKYKVKFFKDEKFRKKIEFLHAVSINELLIGEIFRFQTKFKINTNIPYTKYYFHDDEIPHIKYFNSEEEIPKEQEEYIKKIYKTFYINPFLYNIFIDLLYMQKVNLDDIVLDDIKISTYDGFHTPNGLTIEILSKSVSKTSLIDYIDNNWDKKIKPSIKYLPDEKDLITIPREDVKLYEFRNFSTEYEKDIPFSKLIRLRYNDKRLKTRKTILPFSEIYRFDNDRYNFSKRFKSSNSLKAYYHLLIKKVSKLFEKKSQKNKK